jgi:hypothetical protein
VLLRGQRKLWEVAGRGARRARGAMVCAVAATFRISDLRVGRGAIQCFGRSQRRLFWEGRSKEGSNDVGRLGIGRYEGVGSGLLLDILN